MARCSVFRLTPVSRRTPASQFRGTGAFTAKNPGGEFDMHDRRHCAHHRHCAPPSLRTTVIAHHRHCAPGQTAISHAQAQRQRQPACSPFPLPRFQIRGSDPTLISGIQVRHSSPAFKSGIQVRNLPAAHSGSRPLLPRGYSIKAGIPEFPRGHFIRKSRHLQIPSSANSDPVRARGSARNALDFNRPPESHIEEDALAQAGVKGASRVQRRKQGSIPLPPVAGSGLADPDGGAGRQCRAEHRPRITITPTTTRRITMTPDHNDAGSRGYRSR